MPYMLRYIYIREKIKRKGMNGYSIIADNYRHLMEQGNKQKQPKKKAYAYMNFLPPVIRKLDKCIMD